MDVFPVEGQMMARNPPDLVETHVKGVDQVLAGVVTESGAAQLGQPYPQAIILVRLFQGSVNIAGYFDAGIMILIFVIKSEGLAVENELFAFQVTVSI